MEEQVGLYSVRLHRSFQLLADLYTEDSTYESVFIRACGIMFDWVKTLFVSGEDNPLKIPNQLFSFSREHAGRSVDVIYDISRLFFSLRVKHLDEAVAARMWISEIEISKQSERIQIAVQTMYSSHASTQIDFVFGRPSFIAGGNRTVGLGLLEQIGIVDVRRLEATPQRLNSTQDLSDLFDLVFSERRRMPVVVVSQVDPKSDHYGMVLPEYLINVDRLAKATRGFAHIVCLPDSLTYEWSNFTSREWGVFDGAVRIYYPSDDFTSCNYVYHKLWVKERILAESIYSPELDRTLTMGDAFISTLISTIQRRNTTERILWKEAGVKPFFAVNRELMQKNDENNRMDTAALEKIVLQLQYEVQEKDQYIKALEDDSQVMENEIDRLSEQFFKSNEACGSLRARLCEKLDRNIDDEIPLVSEYSLIPSWIDSYFSDRLYLHPRARRMLDDAEYEDVEQVCKALILLATSYRDKARHAITIEQYEEECNKLSLDEAASISKTQAGRFAEEYYVDYKGKRMFLDRHLTDGNNREPRYCLRIYFFWDSEAQMVVVGSLPAHLTNQCS